MHFFARAMGARHSSLLPARQLNMGYNHSKNLHRIGGTNQSFFAKGYDKALDLAIAIVGKEISYLEKIYYQINFIHDIGAFLHLVCLLKSLHKIFNNQRKYRDLGCK